MNLHKHLTYANVVSTVCLFLLLGGVAYAGSHLAKGSVGTNALKAEAVTKGKLHPNSVNSKKVVNGSLTGEDIASSTLGKVPSATDADHAGTAESAEYAANAANAEKLAGHVPGEFGAVVLAAPEGELVVEGEVFFSASGSVSATALSKTTTILPNRRLRATDFAVHLEGAAQAGVDVHVSLVVNGAARGVCTVTEVPSTCTPSTAVDIPAGAQVAWQTRSDSPVAARPEFAMRLLPAQR